MNVNDELTETENIILRKLRSSYGILTDERNSYVLLQRRRLNGTIRNAGNQASQPNNYTQSQPAV